MDSYGDGNNPWEKDVAQKREDDIEDWNNLPKLYVRKSNRTTAPSSSTDILAGETYGDGIFLNGFLYIIVNNGGTLKWQRVALSDF